MKRKCKAFIALIAALLIVATLCAALVACNGNDDKTKPDETPGGETPTPGETPDETTDAISEMISDELLEKYIGFVLTEGGKSGMAADLSIILYTEMESTFGDDYDASFGTKYIYADLSMESDEDEIYAAVYTFESESAAEAFRGYISEEGDFGDAVRVGKTVYSGVTEEKDFYENTVLKSSIPESFSKTRLDYIMDFAHTDGLAKAYLSMSVATDQIDYDSETEELESWESFEGIHFYPNSNRSYRYNFEKVSPDEVMTDAEQAAILAGYADGSSIDYTKESGYVFVHFIDKMGFKYRETTFYPTSGDPIEGIEIYDVIYDENTPKDLVIPAELDGKKVIKADIYDDHLPFETITLSEGILEFELNLRFCKDFASISLPSTIKRLPSWFRVMYCDKFTTIKYAGTMDEWKALAEASNVDIDDWCEFTFSGVHDPVKFTITVQCKNGSITYPTSETPGGETPTPGEDQTTGIAKVFSREQFNALVGYAYSLKFESNVDASVTIYIETYSAEELAEQAESTSSHAEQFKIMRNDFGAALAEVMYTCGETEIDFAMYYLDTPERAQTVKNILGSQAKVVGNIVVILAGGNASEFYTFENEIANATLPASLSTERKNFYGEAYDRMLTCKSSECYVMGSATDSADSNGKYAFVDTYSSFTFAPQKGNREETIYFSRYFTQDDKNALLEDKESFLEQPFTDDSYFDMDREDSFAYVYYKMSPGFVYEVIGDGDYYEECRNKLCVTDYYYDEMPAEVVIPDQIDGVEVVKVELSGYGFQSLVLPEGLITLRLTDDVIDHITLPATVQFAELNCKAIKTITVKPFSGAIDKRLDILLNGNDALETIYFEGEKQYFKDHLAFMFNNYNIKNRNVDIVCEDGTLFCDEDGVVKDKQTA